MTAILKAKWHGGAALIWLLCGYFFLLWFVPNPWPEGWVTYLLVGWIAPVLWLAFSGLLWGSLASRVCAIFALATLAALVLGAFISPYPHTTTPNKSLQPTPRIALVAINASDAAWLSSNR